MNNIPIKKPTEADAALFEQLVAMGQLAKRVGQASRLPVSESKRDARATFVEEAKEKELQFMGQVAELLNVDQASRLISTPQASSLQGKRDACVTIKTIHAFIEATPKYGLGEKLNRLTAECESAHAPSDLFAVIKQEGRV